MDSGYTWANLIALGLAVAVFVILIVVLTRNNLNKDLTGTTDQKQEQKVTKLDNKINWLYALNIAQAGVVIIFGVLVLLSSIRMRAFINTK